MSPEAVIDALERYAGASDGLVLSIHKRADKEPAVSVMGMFGHETPMTDDERKDEIREAIAGDVTDYSRLPGLDATVERVWAVVNQERIAGGALYGMGATVLEALAEAVDVG